MSSKGKGRKSSKANVAAASTIIVVILLAHSLASGSAMWFLAGVLFLGVVMVRRLFGRKRRGGLYFRRRITVLPGLLWLNLSRSPRKGWSHSWTRRTLLGVKNSRTDQESIDLPGGFHWKQ